MSPEDKHAGETTSLRERAGRAVQSAGSGLTIAAVILIVLALASAVPQLLKAVPGFFSGSQ